MSSVNWPLRKYRHISVGSAESERSHNIHDKGALFFLIILVSKECVIVHSLGARILLINVGDLLLQLIQAVPVSHDIVGDIFLQALYSGHTTLKERMQDDFLWNP